MRISDPAKKPLVPKATVESINTFVASCPFNAWLGLEATSAGQNEVELRLPWRVELGGAPGMIHGGVLAAMIDVTAYAVLMSVQGSAGPTIDMRVDFHRSTANGLLHARGRLLRAGATICTVEVVVHDAAERLIASGRCVFLSQSRMRIPEDEATT